MIHRLLRTVLLLSCAIPLGAFAQGLTVPGGGTPVSSAFDDGFAAGLIQGRLQGHRECYENPSSCSIHLSNVLPPAQHGEREPNDTMVSANPLILDTTFWGQSYGPEDRDWFYLVTPEPNFNLTVNVSFPPETTTGSWNVSIRNGVGMMLAQFNVDASMENPRAGVSYQTILGLAGTYYVLIQPNRERFSHQPYNLAVNLRESPIDGPGFAGGYFDVEIEPNNMPGLATRVTRGVSMFGMVNLRFDAALCSDTDCEFAQDEPDWFVYNSPGNEIVNLGFCERAPCGEGDWSVRVFDELTATLIQEHGLDPDQAAPLVSFNTQTQGTSGDEPNLWHIGLRQPGMYYMRIGHARTLRAPCIEWAIDSNRNGLVDGGACACSFGTASCEINVPTTNPFCDDGSESGVDEETPMGQCAVDCRCTATTGEVQVPDGPVTSQYNFTINTSPFGGRP